jgi:hypothetical protein
MTALSKLSLKTLIVALAFPIVAAASQTPTQTTASTAEKQQPDTPAKPHQPRPNPDALGKYHAGNGVTPPVLIHSVEPEFEKSMKSTHARYIVAMTVGTDGKPTDVHIVPPPPTSASDDDGELPIEIRTFCMNAVEAYRFRPATFQGKPVPVDLKVEINFRKPQSF